MTQQYSATHRTNAMTQLNTDIGASAVIKVFSGSAPANCAAADTGTLLATFAGNAGGFGTASAGVLTASAVASTTGAAGAGTGTNAGYFRIYPTAATTTNDVVQGTVFPSVALSTSASTSANSNILNFTATTGVAVGMSVSGTGVAVGSTVLAVSGTTVTMSQASSAGVASSSAITFGGDMTMANTSIASGQTVNFISLTVTAFGA